MNTLSQINRCAQGGISRHIETVNQERGPIYVAGFPIERAFIGREDFEGLPAKINVDLVFHRFYKFFQTWPMPQVVLPSSDL